MKSNICPINKKSGLKEILSEVDKVSKYTGLTAKESFRLRLLAEELSGMLPELVKNFDGNFWVENEEKKFELHVELLVDSMDKEKKDALIEVSKNKKNSSAVGFMGKIRDIAENMLLYSEGYAGPIMNDFLVDGYTTGSGYTYSYSWTLDHYSNYCETEKKEKWDELEKSIVAKLADDVIVGVKGKKVDIIIKKAF